MTGNRRYLAASDFDGTINIGGVSAQNREAIRRFREAGHLFGIATGRDYNIYHTMLREGIEFDFIVTCSGAMAIKPDGTYYFCVDAENKDGTLRQIIEYAGERFSVSVDCIIGKERFHYALQPGFCRHEAHTAEDADQVPSFTQLDIIFKSDADCMEAAAEINRRWGHAVNALQNGSGLKVVASGMDKGEGSARIAALAGIPEENIYTFGDNINDIAMLTRFHGYPVANAREEVKAAVGRTCEGVWEVLERLTDC